MPDSTHQPFLVRQCRRRAGSCVTVMVLAGLVFLILLVYVALGNDAPRHASLLLVAAIFRHGDRTPTETYPTDPHKSWPEGWGELTKTGKMQMFRLGEWLRKRYTGFLSELYFSDDLLVQSSAKDRCVMSALALLAGLYPPVSEQVWNPELNWQPIPVFSTPRQLDQLIAVKKPCPRFQQELKLAYNSPEIQQLNKENADLFEYLTEKSGEEVTNISTVEQIFNTLSIEEQHKLPLPEWTKLVYPDKMKDLAAKNLAIYTHTPTMKRFQGGPLIKEITQNMNKKIDSLLKPNRKLFLYSGHDLTIVNVWRTLGFTELLKPDYGATLLIELHSTFKANNFEVKMFYLNSTEDKEVHQLTVPGCSKTCLFDTLQDLMKTFLPENWDQECQLTK